MTDEPTKGQEPATGPTSMRELVPSWLQNLASLSWRIIVIGALAVVLWYIASSLWTVTASIIVAIVVAAVFAPFVLRLRDRGRSRGSAALIVWASAILVIGGVVLLLILAFLPYVVELVDRITAGVDAFKSETESLQVPPEVVSLIEDVVENVREAGGELVGNIVGSVAESVGILVLATFLLYFFLRDGDKAWLWFFESLRPEKLREITTAGDEALAKVGGYLRGTTVLGVVIGVTDYIFMLILGVPLALPLALLAFVTTYIPYFGGFVASLVIVLVTLSALGTGPALLMILLLGVRTFLVSYGVRPVVYSRTVSLHPALVLIVLPAGFQLAGMVGLFAAVPITAVIVTVARSAVDIIEPDDPPPLPELVPAWLDRAAQWSWRVLVAIALAAALVLILTTIPLVILPIVLAMIFAATILPVMDWLIRRGWPRGRAAAVSVGGASLLIVGVLTLAVVSLVAQAPELADTTVAGAESINEAADGNLQLAEDAVGIGATFTLDTILAVTDELAGIGAVVLLSTLLTFYFLRDGARLWTRVMDRTHSRAVERLNDTAADAFAVLGGYMTGTAAISFVGAFSQWVIMVVLGLPLALPVFVLSFFGGFIPYIGSALTTGLAFLIAVAVGDTVDIVVMLIWTLVFNIVQGNIVAPAVYNRTTNIHPAIVLAGIPAASSIAGILGMFLVVPVMGVVATSWRTVLSLLGSDDTPTAEDASQPPSGVAASSDDEVVPEPN